MLESTVERYLKASLEKYGFKVLKLTCPGTAGVTDRLILRPKHSPGNIGVVEVKAPGKKPRRLQQAVIDDWRARGAIVHDPVSTIAEVDALVAFLLRGQDWSHRPSAGGPPISMIF